MGSPITFSGFNQIDFNLVLNAVMQQERAPLAALETRKKTLETQNATFGTFLTRLSALETAVSALAEADSLSRATATSSDSGVGVTAAAGTLEGTYDVVVSQLARGQVTASASVYSSPDTVVAAAGTLTLTVNGQPVDIAVTGPMTLRQLAEAINGNPDAPANASVVQTAPGSYQLVLTGRATGAGNAFTITSTLTGGEGLAFADGNGNGIFGEDVDGNTQQARDAAFTVNGLAVASASNVVQDVIPGATLTLTREDPARTIRVTVERDDNGIVKLLEAFATAYNDLQTFMKEQHTAAATGEANIGRDPIVRGLRDSLRSTLFAEYSVGGAYSSLAAVGVEVDAAGRLKVEKSRLEAALADAPASVQALFAGASGQEGVFGAIRDVVAHYTESGGLVATVRQRLGENVSDLNKRLDAMEAQLAVRRAALQREFIAADMLMTRLRAQSSSLGAVGAQFGTF